MRITADTLKFDTVFTTAGSIYQHFTIGNENNKKLKISSVKLAGGIASPYKINVDGVAGVQFSDLELAPNDSIHIFVQVNVNPSAAHLPFIIQDSIEISYNGNLKKVQLEAWGQNAHFFRNKVIAANETWNNDLPYVILGSLTVNQNQTLTINKGCRIFAHADAPIIINGTLQVNGLKDSADRVYFTGDRRDSPYKDFPASWPGIIFQTSSKDNILNYTLIKNAYQAIGIKDPATNGNPKLTLNECIIDNAYDAGIISINSSIAAQNCLISNCGRNLLFVKGGNYQFVHCTVATYANQFIQHKEPVLFLSNYISENNTIVSANLNALFRNCIFWGENGLVDDEVVTLKDAGALFNVNFDYNLWKVQNTPTGIISNQIINNQAPLFDSINTFRNFYDFHLSAASPALNKGTNTGLGNDLDGNPRPVGLPDLGCYERQ